jgi:hypothetical protein
VIFLLISLFTAWRYSKTSVDPDWAYFNLWGFTGSVYGRDFADCKTPLVHLWYLGLSKLVGKSVARAKFANHFLIGSVGAVLYFVTGDFMGALAYTVLVNSGWLLAFHGNVGQIPAALIALSFIAPPPLAFVLWGLAVLYEPKLIFSFVVYAVLSGWWLAALLVPAGLLGLLFKDKQWFKWLWESSVTIPVRMSKNRKGDFYKLFMPWFTSNSVLYLTPWLGLAVLAKPDFFYWLPALVYALVIASGKVVRQNHFIPLVPFIAFSGLDLVPLLVLVEFASAGFYLGDIWLRFYPALADLNTEAEKAGAWLKEKAGTLYVNGIHSGMYVHALKPVPYGFAEQIEIREVAKERRAAMIEGWKQSPPDWLVEGRFPGMRLNTAGYQLMQTFGENKIYRKR